MMSFVRDSESRGPGHNCVSGFSVLQTLHFVEAKSSMFGGGKSSVSLRRDAHSALRQGEATQIQEIVMTTGPSISLSLMRRPLRISE